MIYVYALCDPSPDLAGRLGLEDQPLELVAIRSVAAVYSQHEALSLTVTSENVWRHEGVVEALMDDGAVLPVRFGTTFAAVDRLRDMLARHAAELAAGLERVRGLVELGVRVLDHPPTQADQPPLSLPPQSSGRAYMRARLVDERRQRQGAEEARRWADELHAQFAAAAHDSTRQLLVTPRLLLTAAYLVPRAEVDAFRQRVEALGRDYPSVRILCTGPWPAYHFVPSLILPEANYV